MSDNQDRINELLRKMDLLLQQQDAFTREMDAIKQEVNHLKGAGRTTSEEGEIAHYPDVKPEFQPPIERSKPPEVPVRKAVDLIKNAPLKQETKEVPSQKKPKKKSDWEKFIGENLINKIGIVITVIGVAIGAKYAIDNQMMSPLTRIILGYTISLGLIGFSIRLKKKYLNFSAVLLSGAMAIMYFITFFAYSFYYLIPQELAFGMMVIFTVFTVVSALHYKKQVIAHIGLVGAYAVPFLLSNNSGQVEILFSYMAILNIGILIISIKQYWKPLYYVAFLLTWLIYFAWYVFDYSTQAHFGLALGFLATFFAIFYVTFLGYKVRREEKFQIDDIALLVGNSFIFYGLGYNIFDGHSIGSQILGLFTVGNALIHFVVSVLVYRKKLQDKNVFYLVAGMVLVFITMAAPVQLDGSWVTLLWIGEATLLFWIGRTKGVSIYEKISYPVMVLAFVSLLQDWELSYQSYTYSYISDLSNQLTPVFNIQFTSSVVFAVCLGYINFLNRKEGFEPAFKSNVSFTKLINNAMAIAFLVVLYMMFRLEIDNYWELKFANSEIQTNDRTFSSSTRNYDFNHFKHIWINNYTLLFLAIMSLINIKKFKHEKAGLVNLVLNVLTIFAFLTASLFEISELRDSFLRPSENSYFNVGFMHIAIRYLSLIFLAAIMIMCYQYTRAEFMKRNFKLIFELIMHTVILWVASSELLHWMDIGGTSQSYKFGLSILWGLYALLVIVLGISKKKKHLRISGIVLFGITLVKLFFYDIGHLNTLSKTIAFISLGALLLIISFLYNKYKTQISDEVDD